MSSNDIKKNKDYLNACELNIKLNELYEFYYELLLKQGVRYFKTNQINDNIKEYIFKQYNLDFKIRLKEIKNIGLVVSYVNYHNYNLSISEQLLKGIEYINQYGFNIDEKFELISIEY